jgi:lysyl-tRNA synthetase class 2
MTIVRSDIIAAKLEKKAILEKYFGNAYPATIKRTHTIAEVQANFDALQSSGAVVTLVGRVRSVRGMGAIAFAHIEDGSGKFQGVLSGDHISPELFALFTSTIEIGDYIQISGSLFITKRGEHSVQVTDWRVLSKSLLPFPTEHYGVEDEEVLLRQRYLDLALHPSVRDIFVRKAAFWQAVRTFLASQKFLEVQTPVLEHIPGGAEAEPFTTHHNALDQDFYLRISLELALKRLLVGGYERVFEIGRVFRNEGIDREHLQEFDHMEFYSAYTDFDTGVAWVEELYRGVVRAVAGETLTTTWEGHTIDWSKPFPRIDYFAEFQKETGIDLSDEPSIEVLQAKARELSIKFDPKVGRGRMIDLIYKKTVRQRLIQPCILVGHPIEVSPLAKSDPTNPRKVLRMQPIACKSELGNGFSELNDPLEQRARFEQQMALRESGDSEAQMLDEDFLAALEYGLPPAFGFGMSERLFAVLMDRSIRETVIFPPMRSA